jgi:hypothetical protein
MLFSRLRAARAEHRVAGTGVFVVQLGVLGVGGSRPVLSGWCVDTPLEDELVLEVVVEVFIAGKRRVEL